MPRRMEAEKLPPELRTWLDAEIIKRGYSDFTGLAAALADRGHKLSRTSIHRYAQRLRERADSDIDQIPDSIPSALSMLGRIRLRRLELDQQEACVLSQLQALGFDVPETETETADHDPC